MTLTNYFFLALYLFCGLISLIYIWNKDYKNEYIEAKKSGEIQDAMVSLLMCCIFIFWPIFIVHKLYKNFLKKLNNI